MISRLSSVWLILNAFVLGLACAGEPDPDYPSQDWSGRYGARVVESSTDCVGADAPPPMTGVIVQVLQTPTNEGLVTMGPFIQLRGPMSGDHLAARARVKEPIALPDSIAGRAEPADSLDTVSYRLEAAFADSGFAATYVVRAPDIVALARGTVGGRCGYLYRLEAQRLPGDAGKLLDPDSAAGPGRSQPGSANPGASPTGDR